MVWDVPQFATTHEAFGLGAGAFSPGVIGGNTTSVVAGSSINSLRDGRTGTGCSLDSSAGGGFYKYIAATLDRGAGTLAALDRFILTSPWSTYYPDGTNIIFYVYASSDAGFTAPTLAGSDFSATSGEENYSLILSTPTTARYLMVIIGRLLASVTTASLSEIIWTTRLTSTTRGPAPGWTDDYRAAVARTERPSGLDSIREYGTQRRTWALTYKRVVSASDRATLDEVIDVGSRRPFLFWPAFDTSEHALVRLVDWKRTHSSRNPSAADSPTPDYYLELEESRT